MTIVNEYDQVGRFWYPTVPASLVNVYMELNGRSAAPAPTTVCRFLPARSGRIVGIVARTSANLTAGSIVLRPCRGDTFFALLTAETATIDAANTVKNFARVEFAQKVPFKAGESIGLAISSSSDLAPLTANVIAWLAIEWDPEPVIVDTAL